MEPKQHYLAVGAFVIAMAVGILAFVVWLSNLKQHGHTDVYQTFVNESVNGLAVGSAVKYRGVDVGRVKIIDIPKSDPNKVRIVMDINEDTPITVGTVAVLQMQGVTGISYVELKGAVAGGERIRPKGHNKIPIIPSAPSDFRRIVDNFPAMLQEYKELAEKLSGFASTENQQRFADILSNLEKFSQDVSTQDENGRTVVEELQLAAKNTGEAAASIRSVAHDTRADIDRLMKSSADAADNVNILAEQTSRDTHQTLIEVRKTARDLQDLSRELKENPSKVFTRPKSDAVQIP